VTSDSRGSAKLGPFGQSLPAQLVEVGIAEQNLVGMAAGLLILADQKGSGARRLAPPAFEEIAFALQTVHGEASAVLADAWNLHPEVR